MKSVALSLLILFTSFAHANFLEDASQAAQYVWTMGKGCPEFDPNMALSKLDSGTACVPSEPSG